MAEAVAPFAGVSQFLRAGAASDKDRPPSRPLVDGRKHLRRDFRKVAHAGLIAAVPLSLSARLKRESDRGRHEARRASVFVNPALIAAMSAKASFIAGRLLPAAHTAPATEELASTS
jgi:hypothetical protein